MGVGDVCDVSQHEIRFENYLVMARVLGPANVDLEMIDIKSFEVY